jgi:hypothetical protein
MNVTFSANGTGVDYDHRLATGDTLSFRMRDIRNEKTGTHAFVGIMLNTEALEADDFNVKRIDARKRLASSAYDHLGALAKDSTTKEELQHLLLEFCLTAPAVYEEKRFTIEEIDPTADMVPVTWGLWPYCIDGGGTIAFGPPQSGKSMLCQIMAVCLAQGNNSIWSIPMSRPVLYVNLERPKHTIVAREADIRKALGVSTKSGVTYLHARGASLTVINRTVSRFITEHPTAIVVQDSISRAGQGSLKEDEVANKIIDQLNSWGTWIGIGHSPRATTDHSYGSIHFEAGQDIGVKVGSETRDNKVGIRMEITKMNDARMPPPEYYALVFAEDGTGLIGFERSNERAFPELAMAQKETDVQKIIRVLREQTNEQKADATFLSHWTGIARENIVRALGSTDLFTKMEMIGRKQLYGLAYFPQESDRNEDRTSAPARQGSFS